jgi:hypothetical protein
MLLNDATSGNDWDLLVDKCFQLPTMLTHLLTAYRGREEELVVDLTARMDREETEL